MKHKSMRKTILKNLINFKEVSDILDIKITIRKKISL